MIHYGLRFALLEDALQWHRDHESGFPPQVTPLRPGDPGYEEANYEVVGLSKSELEESRK